MRLDREARVRSLMIARDRLTLLRAASRRMGSTLDVTGTARELTEAAVPHFADLVTVDLFAPVLRGEEPEPGAAGPGGGLRMRRVAECATPRPEDRGGEDRGAEAAPREGPREPGEPRATDVPAAYLGDSGGTAHARALSSAEVEDWLRRNPRHDDRDAGGARSALAVPLRARGTTLGVAVFVRHRRPDPFDGDDVLLAEEVSAQAAVCVDNARRYTHEHRTALTLQRSLLPRRLPRSAAVEAATRYLPADSTAGVGGDWFDVIQLSGARVALVVGSVAGHGLYASATMGRLRSAVRTLADIDLAPDELLTHLDDVVIRLRAETERADAGRDADAGRENDPGEADGEGSGALGATCLYAVYDPVSRTCTLARAGHPSPALVRPDGPVEIVAAPAGPPLGVGGLPFEATELEVPPGSLLVLFTDGLLAAHPGQERALARLRHTLARNPASPETTCDAVVTAMLDGGPPADDIALLIARTRALDEAHVAAWRIEDEPTAVARARDLATGRLAEWGMPEAAVTTELVVSELVTNAVRHADGPIQLRLIREPDALICEVSDSSSTSPHLRRARILDESGRGLFIVANLTNRWGTRHGRGGKTIWAELTPAAP